MKTVVILTEKPFSKAAVEGIKSVLLEKNYSVKTVEKYKNIEEAYDVLKDANALIVRSDRVTDDVMAHAPNLEIIVRAGAGYDSIDLAAATNRKLVVENTPGQNANGVAELVFGLMLFNARRGFCGTTGLELRGKKLGIQGFGAVGKSVARVAHGFGMDVYFYDPVLPVDESVDYGATRIKQIEELYETCQYISLHIPLLEATRHSINYNLMSRMPQGAVLVNTSRTEIINDDDLMRMFEERPDFNYLADVPSPYKAQILEKYPDRSFFTAKKCGAQTAEANYNAGIAAANQIVNFFELNVRKFQVNL